MRVVLRERALAAARVLRVLQVRAREILERAVRPEVAGIDVVAPEQGLGSRFRAQDSPRSREMLILRDS